MTNKEIKNVLILELIAPSEYDKNLYEIPQDIRDSMYKAYKHNESMYNIVNLMEPGKDKNRLLELAQLIDEKIAEEELQKDIQA